MKLAVLFDSFGPYHVARLRAAATQCDLLGIEFTRLSSDYAWKPLGEWLPFHAATIFSGNPHSKGNSRAAKRRLSDLLDEFRPDVVAIPGWLGRKAYILASWCASHSVPIVVMSETSADDAPRTAWKEWAKRQYVAACSAALVGGSQHRDYLVELGMPADRVFLGYDVVDNSYFKDKGAEIRRNAEQVRRSLNLPARFFLAAARFVQKKNLPFLINAYVRYRAAIGGCDDGVKLEPWDLVVVGDGPMRGELERTISDAGLMEHVHLPGFKQYDEIVPYFALAGAFVHASTVEQWGLVVNEAMASGLPIVASSACGCVPELVADGINGFIFAPTDDTSLTQRLVNLTRDETLCRRMGAASLERVGKWGPERFRDGLVEAAESALRVGAPRKSVGFRCLATLMSLPLTHLVHGA